MARSGRRRLSARHLSTVALAQALDDLVLRGLCIIHLIQRVQELLQRPPGLSAIIFPRSLGRIILRHAVRRVTRVFVSGGTYWRTREVSHEALSWDY